MGRGVEHTRVWSLRPWLIWRICCSNQPKILNKQYKRLHVNLCERSRTSLNNGWPRTYRWVNSKGAANLLQYWRHAAETDWRGLGSHETNEDCVCDESRDHEQKQLGWSFSCITIQPIWALRIELWNATTRSSQVICQTEYQHEWVYHNAQEKVLARQWQHHSRRHLAVQGHLK